MLLIVPLLALLAAALSLLPRDAQKSSRSADTAHCAGGFAHLAEAAKAVRDGNRDDRATQLYRQALKLKPEWDERLWYLGTLLYEKENYFEACEMLRRFPAQDPKAGYGWAMLGMSEFQTREWASALQLCVVCVGIRLLQCWPGSLWLGCGEEGGRNRNRLSIAQPASRALVRPTCLGKNSGTRNGGPDEFPSAAG